MMKLEAVQLDEVHAARERIAGEVPRSPLVRLNMDDQPAEIYLKLENLLPLGSFKIRGAINVLKKTTKEQLSQGISTASSGNWGLALAWYAKKMLSLVVSRGRVMVLSIKILTCPHTLYHFES